MKKAVLMEKAVYSVCVVWGPFMKVAAVDCSQEYNRELCQFYDIKMFPTLKVREMPLCL